ncbi:MAG: hypothetical protein KBT34_10030 [Prevotella sp.]|nr:hypothetical protein [Candidatus Prevotella equi]
MIRSEKVSECEKCSTCARCGKNKMRAALYVACDKCGCDCAAAGGEYYTYNDKQYCVSCINKICMQDLSKEELIDLLEDFVDSDDLLDYFMSTNFIERISEW